MEKKALKFNNIHHLHKNKGDCSTIALSLVEGISYEEALHKLIPLGYQHGKGIGNLYHNENNPLIKLGYRKMELFGGYFRDIINFDFDVISKGKYLMVSPGHIFCIIDGIVQDDKYRPGCRICDIYTK